MTRTIGEALYEEAQMRLRDAINDLAIPDGWFIAESSGSAGGDYQIQRDDEDDRFDGDQEAWAHVWQRAMADPNGNEMAALRWLKRMEKREFIEIKKHCRPLFGRLIITRYPQEMQEERDAHLHRRSPEG